MVRQAHTYLVGALSGVTLIGIAIAAFVVLVSAQVFHEWPIADLSSQSQKHAVSAAKALPAGGSTVTAATARASGDAAGVNRAHAGAVEGATTTKATGHHHGASGRGPVADATGPATAVEGSPAASGDGTATSGGNSGSHTKSSGAPSQGSTPTESGSSSGTTGTTGTSGGGSGTSGGSGGTGTTGSGGGTTGSSPVTATTKPSQAITETVNGTVGTVDEKALGGTLEKTGVTEVTEKGVEGVAGPESAVGQTVDGATETLNGLLGGGSR
jgi:hypothetical protein